MKRYLVFAYDTYYPPGGWHDFKGGFDDLKEAISYATGLRASSFDNWHIVDTTLDVIVEESE